ncbi:hypothetical protein UT300009_30190 [Paraclostridium bifermentans]
MNLVVILMDLAIVLLNGVNMIESIQEGRYALAGLSLFGVACGMVGIGFVFYYKKKSEKRDKEWQEELEEIERIFNSKKENQTIKLETE